MYYMDFEFPSSYLWLAHHQIQKCEEIRYNIARGGMTADVNYVPVTSSLLVTT